MYAGGSLRKHSSRWSHRLCRPPLCTPSTLLRKTGTTVMVSVVTVVMAATATMAMATTMWVVFALAVSEQPQPHSLVASPAGSKHPWQLAGGCLSSPNLAQADWQAAWVASQASTLDRDGCSCSTVRLWQDSLPAAMVLLLLLLLLLLNMSVQCTPLCLCLSCLPDRDTGPITAMTMAITPQPTAQQAMSPIRVTATGTAAMEGTMITATTVSTAGRVLLLGVQTCDGVWWCSGSSSQ